MKWDFNRLPNKLISDNVDMYLSNLSLSLIASLAQGENYNEGRFLLPAGTLKISNLAIASKIHDGTKVEIERMLGFAEDVLNWW